MAHRPSGPGRIPRRRLTGRAGLAGRRLAGFRASTVAAAGAGLVVVLVALALGLPTGTPVAEHMRTGLGKDRKPLRVMLTIAPGDRHALVYELDTT
jgi:hypothetical protein